MALAEQDLGFGDFIASKRGILLDVGCGAFKADDRFVGMDFQEFSGVDIVHDWNAFPWPFEDESCLTVRASHVIEHVNPADGHFLRWMDEVWRILKPGGQFLAYYPYGVNERYVQDPTHCNPCSHLTWLYFVPEAPSGFPSYWHYYKPKPWIIEPGGNTYQPHGDGQIVLRKRLL